METFIQTYGILNLTFVAMFAVVTSSIHGATGVAGGFLLSVALVSIIGIAPIVPVVSISLLISHSARAILNIRNFHRSTFLAISIPAVPCIVLMAFIYGQLSSNLIALILGFVILISIPIRRWAKHHQIKTSRRTLSGIGAIYGTLSGVSIGPGMLLVPFMLGYGLSKEQFVATLAVIALFTNLARISVFGTSGLLSSEHIFIGILCGILTIPGNWLGRTLLRRMTNENHAGFVDILTVLGALNFFWLSYSS